MSADGTDDNPYRSPQGAVEETAAATAALAPAGKGRRFCNWLVDELVLVGAIGLATLAAYTIGDEAVAAWLDTTTWWQDQVIGYGFTLVYYTAMEAAFGVTVGKLLTGTRVVDESGRAPTFRQALLRSLCRLVPFEAFSVLLSEEEDPRGWHDRWPRTRVVLRRPPPVAAAA